MKKIQIFTVLLVFMAFSGLNRGIAYEINLSYFDLQQNAVSFDKYEGDWLFVEVFSHDCPHCHNQHPDLIKLFDARSSQLQMLSLAISRNTPQEVQAFMQTYPIYWDVGIDAQNSFSSKYGVSGTPTMILFDPLGFPADSWVGETPYSTLLAEIDSFLSGENTQRISNAKLVGNPPESSNSLIGSLFGNPIFQAGLTMTLLILIYFRLTGGSKPEQSS